MLLTALVAIAVVVMVRLGFWQLDRSHAKRASNSLITARQEVPPSPLAELLPPGAGAPEAESIVWRNVTVAGAYKVEDEVLVQRANNGVPGFWVVTPLVARDGAAVAVSRGWIPVTAGDGGSPEQYAPPSGEVTVTGLVQASERDVGQQAAGPSGAKPKALMRVDVARLQQGVAYPLRPVWIQLREQHPAGTHALPVTVAPVPLDEGPHLSYAGQWFIFATLTVVVYPLAIRRGARTREAKAAASLEPEPSTGNEDPAGVAEGIGAAVGGTGHGR